MILALNSVSLALEPVACKNQLPQDTEQVWQQGYYTLLSPVFPRHLLTDQPKSVDEQLDDLTTDCPGAQLYQSLGIQT